MELSSAYESEHAKGNQKHHLYCCDFPIDCNIFRGKCPQESSASLFLTNDSQLAYPPSHKTLSKHCKLIVINFDDVKKIAHEQYN